MRIKFFFLLLIVAFSVLLGQLLRLTLLEGKRYRELSEGQRIREKVIRAPRGLIRDRNGEVLVRNRPVYKIPNSKFPASPAGRQIPNEEEFKIISHEEALKMEAEEGLEAASLKVEVVREYVGGESIAQVVGYTGEVTEEEVGNGPPASSRLPDSASLWQAGEASRAGKWEAFDPSLGRGLGSGDIVGRMGVEEQYDRLLRGVNGKELIETDALGKPLRVLGKIEPEPGKDLTLTIDLILQNKATELMKGLPAGPPDGSQGRQVKKGAVVASDPKTGEILALVSFPTFDPNVFIEGQEGVERVLKNPEEPLFNRAIAGLYSPGSVFKIITAAAGLEERVIDKETEIEDVGAIQIGPYRYSNWYFTQYGKKEGMVDLVKAIQRSNDIFFYKVGEWLGVEKLAEWGRKFGIGRILGIDLPGEAEGVMPDEEWKKEHQAESWFLGDTYHLAIGQGNLLVTPLKVNFWTGAIANGGRLCQPRVVKSAEVAHENSLVRGPLVDSLIANSENFVDPPRFLSGFLNVWARESSCQEIGLKRETITLIKEGMREACEPGGTGWPLFNFKVGEREIATGCKTGTAEYGDPEGKTHAWFTVFAPYEEPEIVVTVLVEGGGEGSYVAAPIAKEILEEWFGRQITKD